MLKLSIFGVIIFQLCLAAGKNADWSVEEISFITNIGNRAYLHLTPPFDSEMWLTDTSKSKLMDGINTTVGLQIKEYACAAGTCLIKKAFQVYLTLSDGFRLGPNNSLETETMSTQHHKTVWKGDTKSTHQTIIIMEEDPAVIESAIYLFERHSNLSTLLRYEKGALHLLRGKVFSAGVHDIILVGHGNSHTNRTFQLAGYGAEELARFMSTLKTEFIIGHLGIISLVSCNLGNDLHFVLKLLQVLRSLSVETKLHLYNSFLSVNSEGVIMTSTDGIWKSHDHSRRVIAELDKRGDLLTKVELGCTGPTFPSYKGNILYLQTLDWPNHPQMFVPTELRKKYPSIDCLEGLTWSLFFKENERRRAPDYVPDHTHRNLKAVWLTEPGLAEDNIVFKQIVTIQDLLVEIRYNAREEVVSDLYYVLNECIYRVQGKNLTVSLVGKFMSIDNQGEIEHFLENFSGGQGESSLQKLREGLKPSKFNDFCRQTFQFQQCSYNCERWGHYFMVAVFSASVRNFRTFSLFLMSVIGCEVGRLRGTDSPLCTAFVGDDHPMVTEQPWPEHFRRGFYGCTVDNYELATQDRQIWLDEVVAKENFLYMKSRQLMNGLYHDEQTELEIFGRVKVMNKYVFSSYLEFFRGTPEGKKLKRGCIPTLHVNP